MSRLSSGSRYTHLLVVWLLVGPAVSAGAADWPQWRGPGRDGLSSEKGLSQDWNVQPPRLVWMGDGMGEGYAGVSVVGNRIYTTGNFTDGQAVIAVDVNGGQVAWTTTITGESPRHGYEGSRCTPAVDGNRLYAVASSGKIVCLDSATGDLVWEKDFRREWNGRMMSGWGFSESPLVDGDWVLCTPGGADAMIVALDKKSGTEIWRSEVPELGSKGRAGAGYSSIVVSEGAGVKQYVQLVGQGVIGVRAADGKFLWGYNDVANSTANIPTPIPMGDYVFCSSGYGTGAALLKLSRSADGVDASEVYFLNGRTFQNHHGGMLLVGRHVYCGHGHNNGFPICLDVASGELAWGGDTRGAGSGSASVVYADGHIIFRYQSGEVALVEASPEGYRLKGTLKPEFQQGKTWAHPVVSGGRLYLREQDKLMCYDITARGN